MDQYVIHTPTYRLTQGHILKIVLSFMDSKQNHLMWVFMTIISHLQNKSMNFGKNLNPKQMNNQPIHSHGYEKFQNFCSHKF